MIEIHRKQWWRRVIPTLILALAAGLAMLPARAAEAPMSRPSATPTLANIRFTIRTTSDWTKVRILRTVFGAPTVTSNPAGAEVGPLRDGVAIGDVPPLGAEVEVAGVVSEDSLAEPLLLIVQKGARGVTTVRVENFSGEQPYTVAELRNERSNDDVNEVQASLTRRKVFGGRQLVLPRADARPLVLADWYGWFGGKLYDDPHLADRPLDRFDAWNADDVVRTTRQARQAGIDGFVVSWQGEDHDGKQLANVIRAAEATRGLATTYLEVSTANRWRDPSRPADPAVVRQWLREALVRADQSEAFLRVGGTSEDGGVPVVFVSQIGLVEPVVWSQILSTLELEGRPVRLVGDMIWRSYRSVQWGVHRYNPNLLGRVVGSARSLEDWNLRTMLEARGLAAMGMADPQLFVATVSPGWNDRALRGADRPVVERGQNGEWYQATWNAALPADPDWILVTSWNEWFEATSVQPSVRYGDLALRQTAANVPRHRSREGAR